MYHKNQNINDLPGEHWVDISGYEGLYMVSTMGRVKRMPIVTGSTMGRRNPKSQVILKQSYTSIGYLCLGLRKDTKLKTYLVHCLVARAFLPNPENKKTVNHKYGIITDNRVSEIEWMTHLENTRHAIDVLGYIPTNFFAKYNVLNKSKKIICHTNGKIYPSQREAARQLGLHQNGVKQVCKKRQRHTNGFTFSFF